MDENEDVNEEEDSQNTNDSPYKTGTCTPGVSGSITSASCFNDVIIKSPDIWQHPDRVTGEVPQNGTNNEPRSLAKSMCFGSPSCHDLFFGRPAKCVSLTQDTAIEVSETVSGHNTGIVEEFDGFANVDCQGLLSEITEFEKTSGICKLQEIENNMDCASGSGNQLRTSFYDNMNSVISVESKTMSLNNSEKSSLLAETICRRIDCANGQNCEKHACPECGMSSRDSGLKFCGKATGCLDNGRSKKCSLMEIDLLTQDETCVDNTQTSASVLIGGLYENAISLNKAAIERENDNQMISQVRAFHKNSLSETVVEKAEFVTDYPQGPEGQSILLFCGQKRTFDEEIDKSLDSSSTKVIKYQNKTEAEDTELETSKLKLIKQTTDKLCPEKDVRESEFFVELAKLENPRTINHATSHTIFNNESETKRQDLHKRDNSPTVSPEYVRETSRIIEQTKGPLYVEEGLHNCDLFVELGNISNNQSKANCQSLHKQDNAQTVSSEFVPELFRPHKFQIHPSAKTRNNHSDSMAKASTSICENKFESESESDCCALFDGYTVHNKSEKKLDDGKHIDHPLHASQGQLDLHENSPTTLKHNYMSKSPISNQSKSLGELEHLCPPDQLLPPLPEEKIDCVKLFDTVFGSSTTFTPANSLHIDCLPAPLILHIFHFLPLYDILLRVSLVCKKWLHHTKDSSLWRTVDLAEQIKVDNRVLQELTCRSDKVILLDISDSKLVTNEGFKSVLARCPHLHTLKIVRCHQLSGNGLKCIGESCPKLTELWMDNCYGLCDDSLQAIAGGCSRLRVLRMGQCSGITNSGLEALAEGCPLLKVLMLDHCTMIGDSGLTKVIKKCPKLEELSLMACNLSDQTVCLFTRLKYLRKLDISNNVSVSKATIMEIAKQCQNLRVFGLSLIRAVDDECLKVVAKNNNNLERLHMVSCNLTDQGLESLGMHCKKLNSLDVGWCVKITDAGVRKISELCPLLTYLGLIRCDTVTAETIEELMGLYPTIKYSTFKLESRLLLQQARLQGFIDNVLLDAMNV